MDSQQTEIHKIVTGMFGVASGQELTALFNGFATANGSEALAIELATFLPEATTEETIASLMTNFGFVADDDPASAGSIAQTFFTDTVGTVDTGTIVYNVVAFLSSDAVPDAFVPAATMLANKALLAEVYSANFPSGTLEELALPLSGTVSSDELLTEEGAIAALADLGIDVPTEPGELTLTEIAANAAYAEILLPADATAGEIATAAALTLTTAEAAIAAGATQAEIDAELAILVEAGADDVAAAEAAALRAQIVALAEANTAVSEFLATLDSDTDINTSDDDISTTTAEQTIHYNATVAGYEAVVTVSQAVVATDTAVAAAAKLALQEDANGVILTAAELVVTDATTDLTAVSGLSAANTALIAANAATAAADAAAIETQGALAGASVDVVIVADGQAVVSGTTANAVTGVVTIDTDVNADFASQVGLVLTEVLVAGGAVTMVPVADTGAVTAAEIAFVEAQQALFTDFVAAYNADRTADLAAAAALTGEQAANEAVQVLDPSAANAILVANLATAVTNADVVVLAVGGTVDTGSITMAADGTATATVDGGTPITLLQLNADGVTVEVGAGLTVDVGGLVAALIAASQALEDGQNDLLQLSPLADALATADAAVVAAELTISTLADAADALAASTVINDTVIALELTASEAATDLVGEQELTNVGGITLGANTIAMISNLVAGDAASIADFNVTTDILYFGDAFAVNSGALTTGDNAVVEMFITEGTTAADSLITFETAVFGSDSAGDFFTVELAGVATDAIVISDGVIVGA